MQIIKGQTIENRKLLSETIGVLRFPLMVGVVLAHIGIVGKSNNVFVNIFINYFLESFIRIPVPLYFFISGFLFFYGIESFGVREYREKLKNRVKRLLLPYLLWGVFSIVVKYISYLLGQDDASFLFDDGWFKWIYYVVWDPFNFQLWFIRDLFLVVLISPIIYFLIKRLGLVFVMLLGGAWLFWHKNIFALFGLEYYIVTGNVFGVLGYNFVSLFFFSFGAWFSIFNKDMILIFKRIFPMAVVLYLSCTVLKFVLNDVYVVEVFHGLSLLFGVITIMIFAYIFVTKGWVKRNLFLEQGSQFIYYYHVLFLKYYAVVLYHLGLLHTDSSFVYSLVYLSVPIITILLGLGLYKVGMRWCPKVMKIALGLK